MRQAAPALTAPQTDAAPPTPHPRSPPRSPGTSSPASPAAPGRSPHPPAASSRRPWPPVSSLPGLGWAQVVPREPSAGRQGGVEVVPPARARSSGAAPPSRRLYNRDGNMGRARRGGGCHGDAGRARLGCGNAARPGGRCDGRKEHRLGRLVTRVRTGGTDPAHGAAPSSPPTTAFPAPQGGARRPLRSGSVGGGGGRRWRRPPPSRSVPAEAQARGGGGAVPAGARRGGARPARGAAESCPSSRSGRGGALLVEGAPFWRRLPRLVLVAEPSGMAGLRGRGGQPRPSLVPQRLDQPGRGEAAVPSRAQRWPARTALALAGAAASAGERQL